MFDPNLIKDIEAFLQLHEEAVKADNPDETINGAAWELLAQVLQEAAAINERYQ